MEPATIDSSSSTSQLTAFGDALWKARRRAGLTQPALGEIIGVTGSTIGHWERGHFRPTTGCYKALCHWRPHLRKLPLPPPSRDDKPVGWEGEHNGVSRPNRPAKTAPPHRVDAKPKDASEAPQKAGKRQQTRVQVDEQNRVIIDAKSAVVQLGSNPTPQDELTHCRICGFTLKDGVCINSECEISEAHNVELARELLPRCGLCGAPIIDGRCSNVPNCFQAQHGVCFNCRLTLKDGVCTNPKCKLSPSRGTKKTKGEQLELKFPDRSFDGEFLKILARFVACAMEATNGTSDFVEFLFEADKRGLTVLDVVDILRVTT